jgi:hypothetical protein
MSDTPESPVQPLTHRERLLIMAVANFDDGMPGANTSKI